MNDVITRMTLVQQRMARLLAALALAGCSADVQSAPPCDAPAPPKCVIVDAPDIEPGGPCVFYTLDCEGEAKYEKVCPASSEVGE